MQVIRLLANITDFVGSAASIGAVLRNARHALHYEDQLFGDRGSETA
jgi:hypothetical protein